VRLRVALSALTVAEYFRDVKNQDVLLFVDNIFRFVQAGSEVSTLLGRMPSAVGYQPTLADEMGELQERITSTKGHSITSLQAVYVPADDYTDPAPFTTFAHLDATTELSRQIAALGIYPAVDPLSSSSTILAPEIIGDRHYNCARRGNRHAHCDRGEARWCRSSFRARPVLARALHVGRRDEVDDISSARYALPITRDIGVAAGHRAVHLGPRVRTGRPRRGRACTPDQRVRHATLRMDLVR